MGGIYEVIGIIVNITILSFGLWIILHVLRNMQRRKLLDDMSKVDAKLAAFRINLKSRVKKKAKRFRASYPQSINSGDPIDSSICKLSELSFEKNLEFQDYIDLCKKINYFIDMANFEKSKTDPNKPVQSTLDGNSDFMGTDFKNEISIVRLINDMVTTSKTLNKLQFQFNNFDRRAHIPMQEVISFPSLFELQKVFNGQDPESENATSPTSETSNSLKIA